jgi:hypothetical protein
MQNLRDKLLKAGLVTEEQTKVAETSKPKPRAARPDSPPPDRSDHRPRNEATHARRPPPRTERHTAPVAPTERAIPRLPPLALPGSKAYQRLESLKQLEQDKKLREIVHGAQIAIEVGENRFHFMTRKGKLRRLELAPAQAKLLEEGALAIVERPEPASIEHSLVPAVSAEQMLAISERSVRFFNRGGKPIGFMSDEEVSAHPGGASSEPESNEGAPAVPVAAVSEGTDEGQDGVA